MDKFQKAVEVYKVRDLAYRELPEGVYESDLTRALDQAYDLALEEGDLMDSQIVDYCYGE